MLRILALIAAFSAIAVYGQDPPADRSMDRTQARSQVISRHGIVATEHPLASQAGAQVLAAGGNAMDAAIAANVVMGLVAPMSNGIGGDLFAIVYEAKSGKLYGLNASGWAPAGLSIDFLKSKGLIERDKQGDPIMPGRGIHSATVPGAVDGWFAMNKRFGRKSMAELLAPAIQHAEDGFPVTEMVAARWNAAAALMHKHPASVATFYPNGTPKVGDVFRNPDLAKSLKMIARDGRDAFYKGDISKAILALEAEKGGKMTAADLAEYSSEWIEPLSTTYRGWTVYELPPNGQGLAALEMLNIMETFPLGKHGHNTTESLHLMIEAKKLAYADLVKYVGDPRNVKAPVSMLLSKDYARDRAQSIDVSRANCHPTSGKPPLQGSDTIYLSVVDNDGNMVSLIQSNYEGFGSGLVAAGTGFALHNRGALFSVDPASPNALAGRKRPLHTIIPAFMQNGDRKIAFGIMGGWNQSQAHAQFVSNIVDHGMNIQAAMEAARFTMPEFNGCSLMVEDRVDPKVRRELEARGHQFDVRAAFSEQMGGGQATERIAKSGVNFGASDPRKDGEAIPEPLPASRK